MCCQGSRGTSGSADLSFHPGPTIVPAHDTLPMRYAPLRGGEVPEKALSAALSHPPHVAVRRLTAAAHVDWNRYAADTRIDTAFRRICLEHVSPCRRPIGTQRALSSSRDTARAPLFMNYDRKNKPGIAARPGLDREVAKEATGSRPVEAHVAKFRPGRSISQG